VWRRGAEEIAAARTLPLLREPAAASTPGVGQAGFGTGQGGCMYVDTRSVRMDGRVAARA